jgi:hypothetical protein
MRVAIRDEDMNFFKVSQEHANGAVNSFQIESSIIIQFFSTEIAKFQEENQKFLSDCQRPNTKCNLFEK